MGNKIFFEDETDEVSGGPLTGKIKVRSKSFFFLFFLFFKRSLGSFRVRSGLPHPH